MQIETERLILRPFREADVADVFEYWEKPAVNCFACMKLDSLEEAKTEVGNRVDDELYLAITLKETGKAIGEIFAHPKGMAPEDENMDTYSPCWMLNLKYGGKGYAYEAASAWFDYLFNQNGIGWRCRRRPRRRERAICMNSGETICTGKFWTKAGSS